MNSARNSVRGCAPLFCLAMLACSGRLLVPSLGRLQGAPSCAQVDNCLRLPVVDIEPSLSPKFDEAR